MKTDIKQFKLTNNEEIVCEVAQWNDEESEEIIIKKALKIVGIEDYQRGIKYFALRPWMSFQEDPNELHSLNASHIIVTSTPNKAMMKHYNVCLQAIERNMRIHEDVRRKVWANIDEVNDQTRDLSDEELELWLDHKYGKNTGSITDLNDSTGSNVIKFKPKDTVH